MTWQDAVEYACPVSWADGELRIMMHAARSALEGARDLFGLVVDRGLFGEDSSQMGVALACMAAGLDAHARSIQHGKEGGRDLLVGDGLITRALEIAADVGEPAVSLVAELTEAAMGNEHPSAAMQAELAKRMG